MLLYNSFKKLTRNFIRTRTAKRKPRPKRIDLPPPTPLPKQVIKAWEGFEGTGGGKFIEDYHNDAVQTVLKKLIGRNSQFLKNINVARDPIIAEYKLVHPDKFKELTHDSESIIDRFLKPIPLKTPRKKNMVRYLMRSNELKNFDTCSYVFTDISTSKNDKNRTIIIRRQNGGLVLAPWEVRDRINIVYFGSDTHVIPRPAFVTNTKIIERALKLDKHMYILNYTFSICEPDDPDYIRVFNQIFDDIIENEKYYLIELSPFYGPFLFHAIKNDKFKKVVKYYIDKKESLKKMPDHCHPVIFDHLRFKDLIELYSLVKPDTETALVFKTDPEKALQIFLETEEKPEIEKNLDDQIEDNIKQII